MRVKDFVTSSMCLFSTSDCQGHALCGWDRLMGCPHRTPHSSRAMGSLWAVVGAPHLCYQVGTQAAARPILELVFTPPVWALCPLCAPCEASQSPTQLPPNGTDPRTCSHPPPQGSSSTSFSTPTALPALATLWLSASHWLAFSPRTCWGVEVLTGEHRSLDKNLGRWVSSIGQAFYFPIAPFCLFIFPSLEIFAEI